VRILITGGAGMVGSHCAEFFSRENKRNKVIVLDNLARSRIFGVNRKSVEYNWRYLADFQNIQLIKGDVRSSKDVVRAIGKGVDLVIHAAGQPGIRASVNNPKEDFDINVTGTMNVLDAVRKRSLDTVFIYCSTNKVYGENVNSLVLKESKDRFSFRDINGIDETMSVDLTGHTPYGVSKLSGDLYVQEYSRTYGMKTGVFRMSCTYGTRQFGFEDQGWISWLVLATLFNKPVTIYGNGKQVRDLLYVDDLVAAFNCFLNSKLNKGVFNIGGGKDNTLSLLELLKYLKELTGKQPKISFSKWRASDQKVYITDLTRVSKALKWQPKTDVRSGVAQLVDWAIGNKEYFIK
jgi:CDP-paratose 2-epimerase